MKIRKFLFLLVSKLLAVSLFCFAGCADYTASDDDAGTPDKTDADGYTKPDADQDPADFGDWFADLPGDMVRDAGDQVQPVCPTYVSALADCSYQLFRRLNQGACIEQRCLQQRCQGDDDCPAGGAIETGMSCVTGSCAFCWQDSQCENDRICRGGHCVKPVEDSCRSASPCTAERCRSVTPSEVACPVCVCDSIYQIACSSDQECLIYSHHPYRRCVYGRCVDCRHDVDCNYGYCLPPGMCSDMQPHPEVLYGTWLIGWAGGMDHFSYFRFEPDGTLRRGSYQPEGPWADDIPPLPCWPDEPFPSPLIGTWEPVVSDSANFFVRMSLNVACDEGPGFSTHYAVNFLQDGQAAEFQNTDGNDQHYQAQKVPGQRCSPDFSICETPTYP